MACEEHKLILEKIKQLENRADDHENDIKGNSKDIQRLKENKATNDEKFERVFQLLGELKNSVDNVVKSLKERNERLPNAVYAISGAVVGSVMSGVILWLITK